MVGAPIEREQEIGDPGEWKDLATVSVSRDGEIDFGARLHEPACR